MLDPVKNARVIGYIFLFIALLDVISLPTILNNLQDSANLIMIVGLITLLGTAYGLIQDKLWAVYGVGILAVLQLIGIIYNSSLAISPSMGTLIMLLVYAVLFLWFFSAKSKFSK